MKVAVFQEDSYLARLDAVVTGVDGEWVELDRTIFYAESGGQPGDTGKFRRGERVLEVLDTRKGETPGSILHHLASADHGLEPGDAVETEIDWDRRYRLMRMHTCMHLLGSLIPVPVTGGKVGDPKSRLDFDLGEHEIDKEDLTTRLNRLVEEAHDIHVEAISEAELDANPGLVRTMSVKPPRGVGTIRMIRVTGVDYQPCGGTHLKNSSEVGRVLVSKIENKGRQNRRVHIVFEEQV